MNHVPNAAGTLLVICVSSYVGAQLPHSPNFQVTINEKQHVLHSKIKKIRQSFLFKHVINLYIL